MGTPETQTGPRVQALRSLRGGLQVLGKATGHDYELAAVSPLIGAPACVWPGVRRAGLPRQSPPLTPASGAAGAALI
jgi:hypothetical protein